MSQWQLMKFSNKQRFDAAYEILEQLKHRYGDQLLAVVVEGSTAKQLDHPYSDLELRVVLDQRDYHRWYAFFYNGMFVGISYNSIDKVEKDAEDIDYEWPVSGDGFSTAEVLYDPNYLFQGLRRKQETVLDETDFDPLVIEALMDLYEHVYKVFTLHDDETISLYQEVASIGYWAAVTVGLSNRHRYLSAKHMVTESLKLNDVPEGYADLIKHIYEDESPKVVVKSLWEAFVQWSSEKDIILSDDTLEHI
jgi:kanamycin nucleotidyltransferase